MDSLKVLVVEDEPKVSAFIKSGLEENNFIVDVAYDGTMGERLALSNTYNIVILDIIIPFLSGLELCKKIKAVKPSVPILLLTALGTTDDKVIGFESGADDYLVKPFEFMELLARVKALTRRTFSAPEAVHKLKVADLELDLNKKVALRGGKTITLTAKEYSLLEYFIRNKGRVVSRVDISEKVWDIHFDTGTNVVDVYVNILRKKIDKDFPQKLIHTKVGMGYIFTDEYQ
ncbi:MAG TPA: DNA-binding response regulator [Cytophagales bacterium]|nr:DNA-binding response regulator [Cytophagales bacterium]